MAHTRYLLSLDPSFEVGWVYRVESAQPADGDHWDLFNDLGVQPTRPEYPHVLVSQFRLVDLPADIYAHVIRLRGRGDDVGADEADRLLAPFQEELKASDNSCYLIETVSGDALEEAATANQPFGPGFHKTDLDGAECLEIWGSRFNAPEDFVEYRLMRGGMVIKSRRFAGF